MKTFHKIYTVHNTLITYEVWERHQAVGWKELFGTGTPPAIFDVHGGVADVYYHNVFQTFRNVVEKENQKDGRFFVKMMDQYETRLETIQSVIADGKPFADANAIKTFTKQFEDAWIGLDLSYMPDYVALDTSDERRSAAAREKAFGFYVGADRLIRLTLEKLLPDLGALASYVTLDEVSTNTIPDKAVLEARAHHYIYYKGDVITDRSIEDFCLRHSFRIESVYAPLRKEIRGSTAAGGKTTGPAYILTKGSNRNAMQSDDILVAHNLESSDLALIERASAIVLDVGTYYGSAAIAARALKKPCIINTNIATKVLQSGDTLDVNGNTALVHLVKAVEASKQSSS